MFDFQKFNQVIDAGDFDNALNMISAPEGRALSTDLQKYLIALTQIILGRISTGYKTIVEICDQGCNEKMIIEAAAALAAKLGNLSESVFYAKLSATSTINMVPALPKMLGSFEYNITSIQDNSLLRNAIIMRRKGDFKIAYSNYLNHALLEEDDPIAWEGVSYCARQNNMVYAALEAGKPLFKLARKAMHLDFAFCLLLESRAWDSLQDLDLEHLLPSHMDLLEAHLDTETMLCQTYQKTSHTKPTKIPKYNKGFQTRISNSNGAIYGKYWENILKNQKISSHITIVYTKFDSNHTQASFLLELLAEYRNLKTPVFVFNDANSNDHTIPIYSSSFDDWINIDAVDSITLQHMIEQINPQLIINLYPSNGHLHRHNLLNADSLPENCKIISPFANLEKQLFTKDQDLFNASILPRILNLNLSVKNEHAQKSDNSTLVIPYILEHLNTDFFDMILNSSSIQSGEKQIGFIEKSLSSDTINDATLLTNLGLASSKQLQKITFNLQNFKNGFCDYRYFCMNLWGQERFFLQAVENNIIPALLILPKQAKFGRKGMLDAVYLALNLDRFMVNNIDDIWNITPLTQSEIDEIQARFIKLNSRGWRKGAAISFAKMLDTNLNSSL